MEARLDFGSRQELDQLPRRLLLLRLAEDHQAGTTGNTGARAVRTRQRGRTPLPFQFLRLQLLELADVPRAGNVEHVEAAEELIPDVGDLRLGHLRRPALLEHVGVEGQRATEARAGEIAAGVVVAQQRIRLLQCQRKLLLELVDRHQHRIAVRALHALDRRHLLVPLLPGARRVVVAGLGQQVLAVVDQAGIDIPRHAYQFAVDHIGIPDAPEIVLRVDHGGALHERLQRRQRVQFGELRHPGVAQLAHVRQAVRGERGQQLLVRGGPRNVLHIHLDARILGLEFMDQLADHLRLASHRPEAHGGGARFGTGAAGHGQHGQGRQRPAAQAVDPVRHRVTCPGLYCGWHCSSVPARQPRVIRRYPPRVPPRPFRLSAVPAAGTNLPVPASHR